MSNQQNPEELRDRATQNQQELLNKYATLIADNTKEATIQAVNDQLTHYELLGIQKGYKSAKSQVIGMMQKRLDALNNQNSEKIIQMRAELPELQEFEDDLDLESPCLKEGIDRAHQNYNALSGSKDQTDLPNDLSEALEAE